MFVSSKKIPLHLVNDHGDAKFNNFTVLPSTGNRGTTFVLDCSFVSKNGTGTGMLRVNLIDPKNQSTMSDFLIEARKPGFYVERIAVDTIPSDYDSSLGKLSFLIEKKIQY